MTTRPGEAPTIAGMISTAGARRPLAALVTCVALAVAGCGTSDDPDTLEGAQARVDDAQREVDDAKAELKDATGAFCEDAEAYIAAVDRYGKAFNDNAVTVGDVTTAGADLAEPRESVQKSAKDVTEARDGLAEAEQELAAAKHAQAEVESSLATTPPPPPTTTTTTTPLVAEATLDRVQHAQSELTAVSEGINAETALTDATTQLNAAAFAVEVTAAQLVAEAGCLSSEQEAKAVAAVADYTAALQQQLQDAGYYGATVDGIYGPATVDAVRSLQADHGLPVTGLVDAATAVALDQATAAVEGSEATGDESTAAVQAALKLAGYWSGPVDGHWTPALTEALKTLQTDLGVEPTGAVDAATLAAVEDAAAPAD